MGKSNKQVGTTLNRKQLTIVVLEQSVVLVSGEMDMVGVHELFVVEDGRTFARKGFQTLRDIFFAQ